jgi:cytochrome c oxidase cbb3-type subunit IV
MEFDINTARAVITVLAFASFLGIAWWAYSGARRRRFEDAARLPLDDDTVPSPTSEPEGKR